MNSPRKLALSVGCNSDKIGCNKRRTKISQIIEGDVRTNVMSKILNVSFASNLRAANDKL